MKLCNCILEDLNYEKKLLAELLFSRIKLYTVYQILQHLEKYLKITNRNNMFDEFYFAKREKRKWKQEDKNFENI